MRELGERDLGDELRLDPGGVALANARHLRFLSEWRAFALQRLPLLRLREYPLPVVERLGELDRAVAPVEQLQQPLAPFGERQVDQRLALDLEQVEEVVDDRRALLSLLHRREARPALLVECADLSVDHAVRGLQRLGQLLGDVGEALGVVLVLARAQLGLAAGDPRDDPVAVPLDLELPAFARAGAVLALRDIPLEGRVVERVVLDVNGEMLLAWLERHALRHRPARERSVAFEPEVVVEPARVVTLDHEDRILRLTFAGKRLAGLLRVALAPVLLEAHEAFLARLRPPDFFWVRSTDSRRAAIRSTTSPAGSSSAGGGTSPSALARSSSSSSLR